MNLISCGPMTHISDIKLIRTDTTLDLSQKAEKGMICNVACFLFYQSSMLCSSLTYSMWDIMTSKENQKTYECVAPLALLPFTALNLEHDASKTAMICRHKQRQCDES
ncbi:hypothetical protein ACB098_02G038500 [Castanea mollissima]